MDRVLQDLRHSCRALLRSPGFTLTAVLTLALGIGATTAIFTLVDRVVLRPLPYPESERLVHIDSPVPGVGPEAAWGLSVAGYFHFREEARGLESLGAYSSGEVNLSGERGAQRVRGAQVTASLLEVLRARPALGRLLDARDDVPGGPALAVLGHDFWAREYGSDPAVIGSTIELNANPFEVIGVMAPGIHLPRQVVDVWAPMGLDPSEPPVNAHWLTAVGRLRPGVTSAEAQTELARLTGRFVELFPEAYSDGFMRESGFATRVTPLRDHVVGGTSRVLWILLASVGLVLLIACANVANLFLVRSEARRREVTIRTALGAERIHLARYSLAESLVLSAIAGVLAVLLAYGGLRLLLSLAPAGLPRLAEVNLGWSSVVFAVAVSLLAGAVFAMFPLLRFGLDFSALRDGSKGLTASRAQHTVRGALVIGQIALALVLLASAGLMLRSFQQLRSVEPGFDPANVLTFEMSIPYARYENSSAVAAFYREFLTRVEALPGVQSVGAGSQVPLKDSGGCSAVFIEDQPLPPDGQAPCVGTPRVAPGFFATLGIPLHGTEPTWADHESRSGGVVVSRALADRLWPGEDPLGKGIRGNGWAQPFYRVVGVTGELRGQGLDKPATEAVYFPMLPMEGAPLWASPRSLTVLVRTRTDRPEALAGAIRSTLHELDPTIPIANIQTMEQIIARSESVARVSFTMLLLGVGAAMALLLSTVGLYGVLSYIVSQRWGEIGIRMALGAQAGDVLKLVVRRGLVLAIAGTGVGLLGAFAVTRLLSGMLFGVSPTDPAAFAAVTLVLVLVTLLASYLPARRAARVDPMVALRTE